VHAGRAGLIQEQGGAVPPGSDGQRQLDRERAQDPFRIQDGAERLTRNEGVPGFESRVGSMRVVQALAATSRDRSDDEPRHHETTGATLHGLACPREDSNLRHTVRKPLLNALGRPFRGSRDSRWGSRCAVVRGAPRRRAPRYLWLRKPSLRLRDTAGQHHAARVRLPRDRVVAVPRMTFRVP